MTRITVVLIFVLSAASLVAHDEGFPGPTLKKVFPEATGFTARKKTLTPAQLKQAEQQSGSKVEKTDNPFTFYVALGKDKSGGPGAIGTVLMLDADGAKGGIDLAVGINRDGTLYSVVVSENEDDPALGSATFLNQLRGKTIQSPLKVGQDIRFSGNAVSGQAFLNAIRRGFYLLAAAQGK